MSIEIIIILVIGLTSWLYIAFSIASRIIRNEVKNDIRKELEKKGL